MNGDAINADPDTFHIVRWIAGSLLIYRDKDGEKRYAFGKNCRSTFDLQRDKVTWLTRDASGVLMTAGLRLFLMLIRNIFAR